MSGTSIMDKQKNSTAALLAELNLLRAEVKQLRERAVTHAALHRQDAHFYQMLVTSMNEGLAIQDEEDRITYVNHVLLNMMGYEQSEVLGHHPSEFIAEEHRAPFMEQMRNRREGNTGRYEMIWRAKSGDSITTVVAPSPIFDEEGIFRGAFAVFTDLTVQKRIERELNEERSRLEAVMEHIPDCVYVKDCDGRYTAVNRAKVLKLGRTVPAEVLGKTILDFFPAESVVRFHEEDVRIARGGEALLNLVELWEHADGTPWWELTSKVPVRDASGAVMGMVGISRDVTEERLALNALARSEERFREILEQTRDIAYKVDLRSGKYEYVSPSAESLLGISVESIIAEGTHGILSRLHPGDLERFKEYGRELRRHAKLGTVPSVCEYRLRRPEGSYRWFSENASLIMDAHGDPAARIGTIRDITEAKQGEEALRATSRMEATATLAGGIAHDFNNLMAAVLGNAELIELKMPKDQDVTRRLQAISDAAVQAGKLAQQMLAFAQGGKYQALPLLLNKVIADVLRLESSSFPSEVIIEQRLSPDLWRIMADDAQIKQVVMNLMFNAVEASSDGGRVILSTENRLPGAVEILACSGLTSRPYVYLKVEDAGPGMPPEVCARVFEPFFTTKFQGRGLGLAAVYGIVKNHDGQISVSSAVGAGTIFEVWLPASDTSAELPPPVPAKSLPVGCETILVADDEENLLNPTREMLERMGYTVLAARDGVEAVEMVRTHPKPIHLLLLDMAMPRLGGAETFDQIVKLRSPIKVIVWSGYDLGPDIQSLLDKGAHGFLRKPVRAAELAAEIRRVLDA